VPDVRHTVTALEDAVVLLTVAKRPTPIAADEVDAVDTDPTASYQRQRHHRRRRRPVNASLPESRMT
jgi:hypothetical protein